MKIVSGKDLLGLGEAMRELKDLTDPVKLAERAVITAAEEWRETGVRLNKAGGFNAASQEEGAFEKAYDALCNAVDELRRARGKGEG